MSGISDQDLNAYLDGELGAADTLRVAQAVAASADLADRLGLLRADKGRIAAVYGQLADQPLPARITDMLTLSARPRRPVAWWQPGLAAAAVVLVAVGLFMTPLRTPLAPAADPVVAEALAARVGSRAPDRTVTGTAAEQNAALAATLGLPLRIPDLGKAGFRLEQVAVYGGADRPAALQLSYRDAQARRFTVFLHPPAGPDRFELRQQGEMRICLWQNSDLTAVMLGEMPTAEMLRVASLTYADLNF